VLLSWTVRRGDLPEYIVICEKGSVHLWMNRASMDFYPTEPLPFQRLMSKVRPHWLHEKLMSPRMEGTRVRLQGRDTTGHMGQMREFLGAVESGSAETASAVEDCSQSCFRLRSYTPTAGRLERSRPTGIESYARKIISDHGELRRPRQFQRSALPQPQETPGI